MTEDEKYIKRCIELAMNGLCNAAPNPMVGAVIVHHGRIIGEGYHAVCGEGHAEVNAIASVKDESLLKEATIYVSLEPCSHYGKTPPCADLIVSKGIPRVVIGCTDPFSLVQGRGIKKLRDNGIDVTVGVLEEECKALIRRFVTFNTLKRPYIVLKWAQSADGYIDKQRKDGHAVRLSNEITGQLVHKRRSENKAILVGRRTALLDNPSLTTRNWYGKHPLRLVIDKELSLPEDLNLFDHTTPTLVLTAKEKASSDNLEYVKLDFEQNILPQIMHVLYERKIQSLMVEGGSNLLQSFINQEMWDEMHIEHSPKVLGNGVAAPLLPAGLRTAHYSFHGHTYTQISKQTKE